MITFYSDLRRLVECAKSCGETDLVREWEAILENLQETSFNDHRDLWEISGDYNVHPARLIMTRAAREYKAAKQQLHTAMKNATHPKPRYTQQVVKADLNDLRRWHNDVPPELHKYAIFIVEKLTNRDELDADMHYWGQGVAADDVKRSMMYYIRPLTDDSAIVCDTGSGWVTLKRHLVVDIADWNKVMNGEMPIPESWLNA